MLPPPPNPARRCAPSPRRHRARCTANRHTRSPMARPALDRQARGFSLAGCLVCLAVAGLLCLIALPAFESALLRHRLQALAADFSHDLQLARSLAVSGEQALRLSAPPVSGGTCYVLHLALHDRCRCSSAGASCDGEPRPLRHRWVASASRLQVTANVPGITLHAGEGFVTPGGTFRVEELGHGRGIWYVVSPAGRVRPCTRDWAHGELPPCRATAAG